MSAAEAPQPGVDEVPAQPPGDPLEEVRQAAGAVLASLRWLLDASERAIEHPESFHHVVEGGRALVESFTSGFLGPAAEPADPTRGPDVDPPDEPA